LLEDDRARPSGLGQPHCVRKRPGPPTPRAAGAADTAPRREPMSAPGRARRRRAGSRASRATRVASGSLVGGPAVQLLRGTKRPGRRGLIRKWFGEPPGIGRNRGVSASRPLGAQSRNLQAQTAPSAESGPYCHAEGHGFESHQPLGKGPANGAFLGSGMQSERRREVVPRSVHRPWKPPVKISWISRSAGFAGSSSDTRTQCRLHHEM
jgi:hypothetical protein